MDNGWAVVLGAGIALLGTAVVPWIREAMEARSRRSQALHERLEAPLLRLMDNLLTRRDQDEFHREYLRTYAELNMFLGPRDKNVALFIVTLEAIADRSSGDLHRSSISTLTMMLSGWYAGRVSTDQLEQSRVAMLRRARAEAVPLPEDSNS